ncbi:MAG: hypothetical protein ACI4AQ_05190 [Lachnospiraceae bacterium]
MPRRGGKQRGRLSGGIGKEGRGEFLCRAEGETSVAGYPAA